MRCLSVCLPVLLAAAARAQDEAYSPHVEPASPEAAEALKGFQLADGLAVDLFAAEPMLANPVCLYVDHRGEVYVGETFRHHAGVTDMRDHMDWLDEDLASRTVEDRRAMLARHEGEGYDAYATESERLRLLRDTDGDGRADLAVVFADGFTDHAAGIGAGVLAHGGDVYYTCIPDLWLLRDTDGDGVADERRVLSTGYGVNVALLGHDLHGLRIGFDGRLYFSCGDRGFHVRTESGVLAHAHTGAVLRCNLDGTGLEVWHSGLRNPQELVFDDYGNLFTGDNNSDGGDKARWVNVVEGGESGWRYAYQWITQPDLRGPWNDEKLWYPPFEGQAAYIVPPIANLADGPSGLTYYPGVGLPEKWAGHFFLCDFRGTPRFSGIHAFRTLPRGAFFELGEVTHFVWRTLATDADFGPDGRLYFTDWVAGWNKTGKGRVYRAFDPELVDSPLVRETAELLAEGMTGLGLAELEELLAHPDQRVRQEAQFELVSRGEEGARVLARVAAGHPFLLARLHAVWGLGMAGRHDASWLERLRPLTADPDAEVRAQAVRVLGDERHAPAAEDVRAALADPAPRVRFFAALAAGRLRDAEAVEPLCVLLDQAGAGDPNLRHAGVMGLLGCASEEELWRLMDHPSPHVRMATLLVLRRREAPEIALFLRSEDPLFVLEAARAIHDVPIPEAMDFVAALLGDEDLTDNALARRAINAALRVGGEVEARALAAFVARPGAETRHRVEGLQALAVWREPPPRDRVVGAWRPLGKRGAPWLAELALGLAPALEAAPDEVVAAFAEFAATAGAIESGPWLAARVADPARSGAARAACLRALGELGAQELAGALDLALNDADGDLRAAGLAQLERQDAALVLPRLPRVLEQGEFPERRAAYRILGRLEAPEADELLAGELERLAADLVPAELALDLVLAAEERGSEPLLDALARRRARRAADPLLADWIDALFGGDARAGKAVFERTDLSCVRCHASSEKGRTAVGPDLAGLSRRSTRLRMLESILAPNRRTTPGFAGTVLFLTDGGTVAGRVIEETDEYVRLVSSDGESHEVPRAEIDERRADLSAMPDGLGASLTRTEMRDLLAYLVTL